MNRLKDAESIGLCRHHYDLMLCGFYEHSLLTEITLSKVTVYQRKT